jgi:hypothetical protein
MDLFLRKVAHSAASDNYRVIIRDGAEIEIGSISRQFTGWAWRSNMRCWSDKSPWRFFAQSLTQLSIDSFY